MQYVLMIWDFFADVPFLGWFVTSPIVFTGGVLFWNILSLVILAMQKGRSGNPFSGRNQKLLFFFCAGGTTAVQLLIYFCIGKFYIYGSYLPHEVFPFVYFLTLALLLIAAVHFFILLISSVVGLFKARRGRTV